MQFSLCCCKLSDLLNVYDSFTFLLQDENTKSNSATENPNNAESQPAVESQPPKQEQETMVSYVFFPFPLL